MLEVGKVIMILLVVLFLTNTKIGRSDERLGLYKIEYSFPSWIIFRDEASCESMKNNALLQRT
jgi:hypothetical protein